MLTYGAPYDILEPSREERREADGQQEPEEAETERKPGQLD